MISELKNSKLNFRKLKISDFKEFCKLFRSCFGKEVSLEFFKWRYFNKNSSFCYGVFKSSKLIANVGMVSKKLNNNKQELVFSRHSSMVLKKYRHIGLFSELLKEVKKKINKNSRLVVMWPNMNNYSNFGLESKNILNRKYYLYKTLLNKNFSNKTKNYPIDHLIKFRRFIKSNNNSFFFKNFSYFKNRFLIYKKNEYLINELTKKKLSSFFIIKLNKDKLGKNYVILDHFGSNKIRFDHLSILINNQKKLIFLSKKKITKKNLKCISYINFKIGLINNLNIKEKKIIFKNKEIFLGDTDIFISIK